MADEKVADPGPLGLAGFAAFYASAAGVINATHGKVVLPLGVPK